MLRALQRLRMERVPIVRYSTLWPSDSADPCDASQGRGMRRSIEQLGKGGRHGIRFFFARGRLDYGGGRGVVNGRKSKKLTTDLHGFSQIRKQIKNLCSSVSIRGER